MKLTDLPTEIQNELNEKRLHLHETMKVNGAYNITLVNKEGTRYFMAHRHCIGWADQREGHTNTMPFGGGTYWVIQYGAVLWDRRKNPVGEWDYYWCVPSSKKFSKSLNGTEIPSRVGTKKEVLAIAKQIGIFKI